MRGLVAVVVAVLVFGAARAGNTTISHLWSFDELLSKADEVVIAEHVRTGDTGRRTVPVGEFRLVELRSELRVLAVLKPLAGAPLEPGVRFPLRHFRPDWEAWRMDHPQKVGAPPPGMMTGVSVVEFGDDRGPYLLFMRRVSQELYEPLSVGSATGSVFVLKEFLCRSCASPFYDRPPEK